MWREVIDKQVSQRNSAELQPMEVIVHAYGRVFSQLVHLQQRVKELGDDNAKLCESKMGLQERVRMLELSAAGVVSRTNREEELTAKVDELQHQLQECLREQKDYYKGQCEIKRVMNENETLRGEVARTQEREKELEALSQLLKDECTKREHENKELTQELSLLTSERDNCLTKLIASRETVACMQEKILEYEEMLSNTRKEMRSGQKCAANSEGVPGVKASDVERLEGVVGSALSHRDTSLAQGLNKLPSEVAHTIEQAHGDRQIYAICAARGEERLFTGGGDRVVRMWDASKGKLLDELSSVNTPLCLDSSPKILLAGCADGVARVWNLDTLRRSELTGHSEKIVAASLSQSTSAAFTASADRTVKLWDISRKSMCRTIMCTSMCNDLCVTDSHIYTAHYNGSVCIWDVRNPRADAMSIAGVHPQGVTCVRLTKHGQQCISLGRDSSISVRDVREMNKELFRVECKGSVTHKNLTRFAVSPDECFCALGGMQGAVLLVDINTGVVLTPPLLNGHYANVLSVAWTANAAASTLASVDESARLVLWK
ncbi:hypothetical protein TRVL_02926 [Trypanosoma vivax]|uniref:Uncharacterized protein n=1 Tax=Trypanosoma vivax (strain Y486) TaxID=1055687 RepID=G0UBP4_TRYVY|nr:hypothetical protein TRVL_02926 [Trypanosoma vivax]CCC53241.1 conserved hypothetical protein [Trypanosoma vivax Y486]